MQPYGSSIPLSKAMSEEVLLAWQMNGQPLPRTHGGPVRVVVPGYIGARSVKWITAITVQPAPSENYFQALDYRILPPEADPDSVAAGEGISLSTLALNCDILVPTDGDQIPSGHADHPRIRDHRRRPQHRAVSTCPSTTGTPGSKPTCTRPPADGHGGHGRSPSTRHPDR